MTTARAPDVALVGPEDSLALQQCLRLLGKGPVTVERFEDLAALRKAISAAGRPSVAVVLAGPRLPYGLAELALARDEKERATEVLVLASEPSGAQMLKTIEARLADYRAAGAVEQAPGPYCRLIERICEEHRIPAEAEEEGELWEPGHVAGRSRRFLDSLAAAARVASQDTVLFQGETGAGKSFLARTVVNALSPERGRRFEHVDCGAITESLTEGELLGWTARSFTGAGAKGRAGFFEKAHKGVLFLDEIGHLSPAQQRVLLLVLESSGKDPFVRKVRRIGGRQREIDVQVIAATHLDLAEKVETGEFCRPLYYRIARYVVDVPPLRDRVEDIGYLADRFLRAESKRIGRGFIEDQQGRPRAARALRLARQRARAG